MEGQTECSKESYASLRINPCTVPTSVSRLNGLDKNASTPNKASNGSTHVNPETIPDHGVARLSNERRLPHTNLASDVSRRGLRIFA
jgi:hypothetical protein